jgi:gliding motility-associated-like protein
MVVLFPRVDTTYQLVVHDAGGCKGSAELQIRIYPADNVFLGNDTAICAGAHAVFTANGNFVSYAWSNGTSSNSIDVLTAGRYSVLATDQNNCKSSDSVMLSVYPLPVVSINGGTVLCKNQPLMLDAGAGFASYGWQDGSRNEQFSVSDTGYYRVQVTDQHLCQAADSIYISQFAESPVNFLPADTTVCSYSGDIIQPKGDFARYNWSTGETARTIQVKTEGEYVLQVTDQQGCMGSDSIHIELKDCEALLVFPNAFTPNHDGINDIFRLKYPGHVVDYQLQIFNRWGQLIYSTSDAWAGWDGMFQSELQPTGNYVWIARFTDRIGKKQTLRGSVLLIR